MAAFLLYFSTVSRGGAKQVSITSGVRVWKGVGVKEERTYVIAHAEEEARDGEDPEDDAEGPGHAQLELAGFVLQMEGEDDGDGDDGHVDGEAKIREEGYSDV